MIRVDSADWTGLPSTVRMAEGPYGDLLTEAEDAAMDREVRWAELLQRREALRMLWGPAIKHPPRDGRRGWTEHDGHERRRGEEWTLWRGIVATVAIVINRRHRDEDRLIDSWDLGYWDSHSDGYGYSFGYLNLWRGGRVEIEHDGESTM